MTSIVHSTIINQESKSQSIRLGLESAKLAGKRLGRPRVFVSQERVVSLRQAGHSWAEIARTLHVGSGTVGIPAKLNAHSEGKPNGIPG